MTRSRRRTPVEPSPNVVVVFQPKPRELAALVDAHEVRRDMQGCIRASIGLGALAHRDVKGAQPHDTRIRKPTHRRCQRQGPCVETLRCASQGIVVRGAMERSPKPGVGDTQSLRAAICLAPGFAIRGVERVAVAGEALGRGGPYDDFGRLDVTRHYMPDLDSPGNWSTSSGVGWRFSYAYDDLGRLATIRYPTVGAISPSGFKTMFSASFQ